MSHEDPAVAAAQHEIDTALKWSQPVDLVGQARNAAWTAYHELKNLLAVDRVTIGTFAGNDPAGTFARKIQDFDREAARLGPAKALLHWRAANTYLQEERAAVEAKIRERRAFFDGLAEEGRAIERRQNEFRAAYVEPAARATRQLRDLADAFDLQARAALNHLDDARFAVVAGEFRRGVDEILAAILPAPTARAGRTRAAT